MSALELPHHERISDPLLRHAVDLVDAGNLDSLRDHLAKHSHLIHQRVLFEGGNYFREPTLLEFIAENPIRHGRLPPNIVDVARLLLDAGAVKDPRSVVVRLLLDAGEDPNRYNPEGAHSHSTPLHQAALAGHLDVVRLLVEREGRLNIRDTLHDGTPLDWAEHAGQSDVIAYLQSQLTSRPS